MFSRAYLAYEEAFLLVSTPAALVPTYPLLKAHVPIPGLRIIFPNEYGPIGLSIFPHFIVVIVFLTFGAAFATASAT